MNKYRIFVVALASIWLITISTVFAQENALPKSAAPLINNEVAAVGFIDLSAIEDIVTVFGLELEALRRHATIRTGLEQLQILREVGVDRVYWLHNVEDMLAVPTIVIPWTGGSDVPSLLAPDVAKRIQPFPLLDYRPLVRGDAIILGTRSAIDRMDAVAAGARPDLTLRLAELSDKKLAMILAPGKDTRRVIRESFPRLPQPFESISGTLLADQLDYLLLTVDPDNEPRFEMRAVASDSQSAQAVADIVERATQWLAARPRQNNALVKLLSVALNSVDHKVTNRHYSLQISNAQTSMELRELLSALVARAAIKTDRRDRLHRLRQLCLAIVHYESTNSTFPPAANVDAAGQPLLSWRVHVLPYLGEVELYREFHLDEPWDSPHNRQLIDRMPKVFEPASKPGHTRFLGAAGEGLFFDASRARKIREFRDGVSKTINLVEVNDESAVIWTQPGDWQVDLSQPYSGLAKDDEGMFVASAVDCATFALRRGTNAEAFAGFLTVDGGESLDFDSL